MEKLLIGLSGRRRSGKSEVGKILVRDHGFTLLEFGRIVMELLLKINPQMVANRGMIYHVRELYDLVGYEGFKEHKEGLRLLQDFGVAVREVDPLFWVLQMQDRIMDTEGNVVLTGVRFPNELQMIRGLDGYIVGVERYGIVLNDHETEKHVDDFDTDVIIHNDGTLSDLSVTVSDMIKEIRATR